MCGAPTRRDGRGDDWSTSRVRASSGRRRAQWIVHGYAIDATRQPSTLGLQGCSLMMVCSTECSTSARVCCRSCAARRPRRRSQTRQRRGAAPETALSSAVSSQAQRHQVWCKTPRATGSPSPTPPTLQTIRSDVRDEAKNRAGWQKTGAHHMINSLGALPPPPHSSQNNTKMSAGCCDTDSPWLSWSYWFEPLYTRARKRTIEEQEMIEACTTPRSGRTSFDE